METHGIVEILSTIGGRLLGSKFLVPFGTKALLGFRRLYKYGTRDRRSGRSPILCPYLNANDSIGLWDAFTRPADSGQLRATGIRTSLVQQIPKPYIPNTQAL